MIRNITYIIKALSGKSYLRMVFIESNTAREFCGIKVDFMETMLTQPSGKYQPGP